MGNKYSSILKRAPISYNPNCYYTCVGAKRREDYSQDTTTFYEIQDQYWAPLIEERNKDLEAKKKFQGGGKEMCEKYREKFPEITEQEIFDLKLQFQTFDLNQDGLIDYNELGQVLDDLGDISVPERREQYFEEMDADGSGAIDFEEFLQLIHSITIVGSDDVTDDKKTIGLLCNVGKENLHTLRQLSLNDKLDNNLF